MNRILITVPSEQLTPELRAELTRCGVKIIGERCDAALLLEHLKVALRLPMNDRGFAAANDYDE